MVQTPVNPLKDIIFLDGRSIPKKAPSKFYFALHKPKGLVSVHLLVLGAVPWSRIALCNILKYATSVSLTASFFQLKF